MGAGASTGGERRVLAFFGDVAGGERITHVRVIVATSKKSNTQHVNDALGRTRGLEGRSTWWGRCWQCGRAVRRHGMLKQRSCALGGVDRVAV